MKYLFLPIIFLSTFVHAQVSLDLTSGLHLFRFSSTDNIGDMRSCIQSNGGFSSTISANYKRFYTGLRYQSMATPLHVNINDRIHIGNVSDRYIDKYSWILGYNISKNKYLHIIPHLSTSIGKSLVANRQRIFTSTSIRVDNQDTTKEIMTIDYSRNKPVFFIGGAGMTFSLIYKRWIVQQLIEYSIAPSTKESIFLDMKSNIAGDNSFQFNNYFHHSSYQMSLGYRIFDKKGR